MGGVEALEYEAYEPMATDKMNELYLRVLSRFPVGSICCVYVVHRLGRVAVGEASVVIAVSGPHRKEPMEFVAQYLDLLKAEVPIWKKEIYESPDIETKWKENKEFEAVKGQ